MTGVDEIIANSAFRRHVYDMVPQGATRILDVGCGDGAMLLKLRRDKGCAELYGVELNVQTSRPAAPWLDMLWHVDIEKTRAIYAEKQGFFRYIILHDVLEHLVDPWHTLMKLRSLGAEDCVFLVATPNLHYWRLQQTILTGGFPYGGGLWHSGHLRWFTPASLVETLLIGGLRIDGLYLEIPDEVPAEALAPEGEVRRVEFPPAACRQGGGAEDVVCVEYPRSVARYVPVFHAHKLIASCGRGQLMMEPRPMANNCPMLLELRRHLNLPFDVCNPPPMELLTGPWC